MKRLRELFDESADIVDPAPKRRPGWWVVPASYLTAGVIILTPFLIFGWPGLLVILAMVVCLQLGHKLGTGRWITWDDQ